MYKFVFLIYNINISHLLNSLNNYFNLDLSMSNIQDHMININTYLYNIPLNSVSYKSMLLKYNINNFHLSNSLNNYWNLGLCMSNIRNHILKVFLIVFFKIITLANRMNVIIIISILTYT